MSALLCPTCRHPLDAPDPRAIIEAVIRPNTIRLALLRVLVQRFGAWVETDELVERLYGGRETAGATIRQMACQLRKELRPHGLTIAGHRTGAYRLNWIWIG